MKLKEKITEIVEDMPERCQEVFKLSRYEYMKNKEIAEKLNISIKMVEKHISKALTILRRDLSGYIATLVILYILKQ